METITQTINIVIGDGLANTGTNTTLYTALGAGLIIAATLFLLRRSRKLHYKLSSLTKSRKLSFRSLAIFSLFALTATALTLNLSAVTAAPTLTLAANQDTLTVTVPEGGGTASTTTTLTSGTTNPEGYTLTAALSEPEPGIAIKLKGGDITSSTPLQPGAPALTLKTTNAPTTNDTTEVTLDFTIDSTVTAGQKELKLSYAVADNEAEAPEVATLQNFTTAQCSALPTYTGDNEEAVITLHDPRGAGQNYQVAKLADGNCWMLNNLKLGSTTGTMTLTPSDTNIASNLTLPQVTNASFTEEPDEETINHLFDDPIVYGPVPGDTGTGSTNYGYLYNWSAATAGESRTSHTEEDGDAPYSICPANWRLPTARYDEVTSDNLTLVVYTGGNYSTGGTWSLKITAPITATVGPFPYNVDGDTVAAALEAAVGETVTTNNSGVVENYGETTFTWDSLDDDWEISIDLTDIVQGGGPGLYDAQVTTAGSGTEYVFSGDFPDLDRAFGGTGEGSWSGEPNIAQWQYNGAFKGVFSGYWVGEFGDQGDYGVFWSASAHPVNADYAFYAYFAADGVSPADYGDRIMGFSVRCLLQ